jgi:transcriptional regulator with XRE-family HTH domain
MSSPASPEDLEAALIKTIRAEREALGITKGELAKRAGISLRAQSRYLGDNPSESRDMPVKLLIRYAAALGMDLDGLLDLATDRMKKVSGSE